MCYFYFAICVKRELILDRIALTLSKSSLNTEIESSFEKIIPARLSFQPFLTFSGSHLEEFADHVEVNGTVFNKPFVEKPISAKDHNIYMYYPTSAGTWSNGRYSILSAFLLFLFKTSMS